MRVFRLLLLLSMALLLMASCGGGGGGGGGGISAEAILQVNDITRVVGVGKIDANLLGGIDMQLNVLLLLDESIVDEQLLSVADVADDILFKHEELYWNAS